MNIFRDETKMCMFILKRTCHSISYAIFARVALFKIDLSFQQSCKNNLDGIATWFDPKCSTGTNTADFVTDKSFADQEIKQPNDVAVSGTLIQVML